MASFLQAFPHGLLRFSWIQLKLKPLAGLEGLQGQPGPDEIHGAGSAPEVEPAGDRGGGHGSCWSVAVAEQTTE